jgi:hypothetical protein
MIRSGIVKVSAGICGVIQDGQGKEFYFSITECVEGKLPEIGDLVTFTKDPDFKSTDVAQLVKPTIVGTKKSA